MGIAFAGPAGRLYRARNSSRLARRHQLRARVGMLITGVWLAVRLLRTRGAARQWRLRNRLLVTYLFIAVVPILLIAALGDRGGLLLASSWRYIW